jgi:hypothetical protein
VQELRHLRSGCGEAEGNGVEPGAALRSDEDGESGGVAEGHPGKVDDQPLAQCGGCVEGLVEPFAQDRRGGDVQLSVDGDDLMAGVRGGLRVRTGAEGRAQVHGFSDDRRARPVMPSRGGRDRVDRWAESGGNGRRVMIRIRRQGRRTHPGPYDRAVVVTLRGDADSIVNVRKIRGSTHLTPWRRSARWVALVTCVHAARRTSVTAVAGLERSGGRPAGRMVTHGEVPEGRPGRGRDRLGQVAGLWKSTCPPRRLRTEGPRVSRGRRRR